MVKCEEMKQVIRQYKLKEQLLVPEDELMEEMEVKIEVVEWEEVKGESPIEYLAKAEMLTMKEKFNINQMTYKSKEENIIQKEIDKIINEYQDIISKGDHDIGNCKLIKHAIRLTD